jgi:nicotinamidase-related amidase
MKLKKASKPTLLLIDIQKGFDAIDYWGGERNNVEAEKRAGVLLELWRQMNLPVVHIQHASTNPNSLLHPTNPGHAFKEIVQPLEQESVIKKEVNSAFIGTELKKLLDESGITTLVIAGLTTDHCVSTTTRMAGNYGYTVYLVADACATFCKKGMDGEIFPAELIHQTALASLNEEFCTVVNTDWLVNQMPNA